MHSKIQRLNAFCWALWCLSHKCLHNKTTAASSLDISWSHLFKYIPVFHLSWMWCFTRRCQQLYCTVLFVLFLGFPQCLFSIQASWCVYCSTCGVQQYPCAWFYPQLCEMLSQNHYLEMLPHESAWMCRYSERVCVRVHITACYRTVVYSLSLGAIWCSWLSSNLIWEHLIPRCLFPLCLISVSHKRGAGEI